MSLLQLLLVAAAFVVIFSISLRIPGTPMVVLLGFTIRSVLAVFDNQQINLPWSGADSVKFYSQLIAFTNAPALTTLYEFPISKSAMYPWINSWIARLAGTNYLFVVFINVVVGTFSILQAYALANEFLDRRKAIVAAWFVCLFPVSAVLSAVFIRETFITALIIAAFRQLVLAVKNGFLIHVVLGGIAIFAAATLHGALILCLLIFPLGYLVANIIKRRRVESGAASPVRLLIVSSLLLGVIVGFGPKLSKVGDLEDISDVIDARARREARRQVASNSDYPVFLSQNIYRPDIAAIRYLYFMFAPFPWSWRGIGDVAGTMLGLANAYAFWLVFRARRRLDIVPLTLFLSVVLTTLMYSAGVSNVGTAIRHRNKALPVLFCAVMAARPLRQRKRALPQPAHVARPRFAAAGR